jgi:hypothetical protein
MGNGVLPPRSKVETLSSLRYKNLGCALLSGSLGQSHRILQFAVNHENLL